MITITSYVVFLKLCNFLFLFSVQRFHIYMFLDDFIFLLPFCDTNIISVIVFLLYPIHFYVLILETLSMDAMEMWIYLLYLLAFNFYFRIMLLFFQFINFMYNCVHLHIMCILKINFVNCCVLFSFVSVRID